MIDRGKVLSGNHRKYLGWDAGDCLTTFHAGRPRCLVLKVDPAAGHSEGCERNAILIRPQRCEEARAAFASPLNWGNLCSAQDERACHLGQDATPALVVLQLAIGNDDVGKRPRVICVGKNVRIELVARDLAECVKHRGTTFSRTENHEERVGGERLGFAVACARIRALDQSVEIDVVAKAAGHANKVPPQFWSAAIDRHVKHRHSDLRDILGTVMIDSMDRVARRVELRLTA